MIRIRHFGGSLWGIESQPYSRITYAECKATPGMRWDGVRRAWTGYVDAVDAAARRIMAQNIRILDVGLLPDPSKPRGTVLAPMATSDLRPYQVEGVAFLVGNSAEGAFLADEVGCGKTLQCIRAARALRGRTIIVVPNFLKSVWLTGLEGDKTLDPRRRRAGPTRTYWYSRAPRRHPPQIRQRNQQDRARLARAGREAKGAGVNGRHRHHQLRHPLRLGGRAACVGAQNPNFRRGAHAHGGQGAPHPRGRKATQRHP